MKLDEALRVSETELALDYDYTEIPKRAKAKRIYYQSNGRTDKYIVAYTKHNFEIVWADSMIPITYSTHWELEKYDEVFSYDDWEPY